MNQRDRLRCGGFLSQKVEKSWNDRNLIKWHIIFLIKTSNQLTFFKG